MIASRDWKLPIGAMKPLLKWAGGKRHIAEQLKSLFPVDWDSQTYIEPFFGGGALFLHLAPKHSIISDLNSRLCGFYNHVKLSNEPLFESISNIAYQFNQQEESEKLSFYLQLREKYNESDPLSLESASMLFALNKLCFNGLYRENSKGFFNVPFGKKKQFPELSEQDFNLASELLIDTLVLNQDFEATLRMAKAGDFVYLDPPYIPLNVTSSFTSYQAEGFSLEDQQRLAKSMLNLKDRGVKALCSNSETPVTREIFAALRIETIEAPRMVSAKASGRGSITELVIMNY